MASQKLVNVFSVTLAGGEQSYIQPHGLFLSNGAGAVPHQITCDRSSPIGVVSCDATNVVFQNLSSDEKTAVFRVEYDHSIYSAGTPALYWRGANAPAPPDFLRLQDFYQTAVGTWYVVIRHEVGLAGVPESTVRFDCEVTEEAALSSPGPLGTYAIRLKPHAVDVNVAVNGPWWFSLRSVTLTTRTSTFTQAKLLVILDFSDFFDACFYGPDRPTGTDPVTMSMPIAVLRSMNGSQSLTPIVSAAHLDGSIPAENGVPYRMPMNDLPCIRVSVAGLSKADADVVTDPAFGKLQSLTIQF